MTFSRFRLESSTYTNTKKKIRSTSSEIQKTTNHTSIKSNINHFSSIIFS
ncbi:hypothetical protein LguiB_009663 [Lonicera macranthoides]